MSNSEHYLYLADAILVVHFLFVTFVVAGFILIIVARMRRWPLAHNRIFRNLHVLAISVVVLQAWLGKHCPLTLWESAFRRRAGESGYSESFIQHWLHTVMYFDAAPWVFTLLYTVFGILVLVVWFMDRKKGPAE
jgi:hypothetical protein